MHISEPFSVLLLFQPLALFVTTAAGVTAFTTTSYHFTTPSKFHRHSRDEITNSKSNSNTLPKLSSPSKFPQISPLFMTQENKSNKRTKIDPNTRSRLLSESIAPWRTLRLFLYFALGSGAGVGGLITAAGVAAYLSGARSDLDINAEYINLAIDFGAVAVFALLAKWDLDKAGELDARVKDKLQKKKENRVIRKSMKDREKSLSMLNLEIRVSEDGTSQIAPVEAVQRGGKQHLIIVAGPRKAIRDSLLGANLLKMEFAMRDVLIVPYELGKSVLKKQDEAKLRPDGSGFGGDASIPTWETQPYVAQPVGVGWDEYIEAEMNDAVKQNGVLVKQDGIAIVVSNSGEIIRRGVGKVPWRSMVEELEKTTKEEPMLDLGFL
jgi:hypothetical protein